jgi:hypothetical protein
VVGSNRSRIKCGSVEILFEAKGCFSVQFLKHSDSQSKLLKSDKVALLRGVASYFEHFVFARARSLAFREIQESYSLRRSRLAGTD